MSSILVDSDVLIEVSRGRDHAILARWEELIRRDTPVFCSPITVAEIWHGARPNERDLFEALFAAIRVSPSTRTSVAVQATISGDTRKATASNSPTL